MNPDDALLSWVAELREAEQTDAELLARFRAAGDEGAFAALVRRHGPMVLGVCRRVLRHRQDAEDAYQAAFLVLARRAKDVGRPERLAGWLYGVAYRAALEARKRARRQARERLMTRLPEPPAPEPPPDAGDLRPVLDEELARLPEKYRIAVLLCDVQGQTREQAARQLGLPVGTLSGRLTTAHRRLARRLARRGVVAGLTALLAGVGLTGVPKALVAATVRAGVRAATAGVAGSGAPPAVASLAEAVLKALSPAKGRWLILLLLAAAVAAPGAALARALLVTPAPETASTGLQGSAPDPGDRAAKAPPPRRDVPLANDLDDVFVVSDLDVPLVEYFRRNQLLVAELTAEKFRQLAASRDMIVDVSLPVNSPNDSDATARVSVWVIPPADRVRKLIEPALAGRPTVAVILRHEGAGGVYDVVGYTRRPAEQFFAKADPVTRSGDVTQQGLRYRPAEGDPGPPPPWEGAAAGPASPPLRKIRLLTDRGAPDLTVFSDCQEGVADFFRRQRVAVASLAVADYEALLRTTRPWLELDVDPISFNDDDSPFKRPGPKVRVAPPPAVVEANLLRPVLTTSPQARRLTVILRRDGADEVYTPVGFSTFRTAYQFFEKDCHVGPQSQVTQKDLRWAGPNVKP